MLHINAKKEDTHVANVQPRNTFYEHIPNVSCALLLPIIDYS